MGWGGWIRCKKSKLSPAWAWAWAELGNNNTVSFLVGGGVQSHDHVIGWVSQMSPWQLESVQDGLRNLPLKFVQNRNWAYDLGDEKDGAAEDVEDLRFEGGWH